MNIALGVDLGLVLSIILKTLIITGILLVIIKWLESKGVGQFTTYQLIVVLSFGFIVGEAIINSDISTAAMTAAVVTIVIVFKLLDYLSTKNKRLEKIINPDTISLVKDGIIDKEGMIRARIGIKEINSFMRLAGIRDVNEIEISNLELNGQISFIKKDNKIYLSRKFKFRQNPY